jgi:RNA polymerase sigma-70 factor, ECF subfamily
VVVLTFFADRSADEVAKELGLAAGNVRVIRHRALAKLRECMSGEAA